jgi:hypothetical protein
MMNICRIEASLFFAMLAFLFLPAQAYAVHLTETISFIRNGKVEIAIQEEGHIVESGYTSEKLTFGLAVTPDFALWLSFSWLHYHGVDHPYEDNVLGDATLKAKFFIGDYADDTFHIAFITLFNFPLGPNAYEVERWRNLALGKNEITLGPIFRIDLPEKFYLHLNLFYTLREGDGEVFYSGFDINIFTANAWIKVFGFNPFESDTFFSFTRLKNDYVTLSIAANTDRWYPFIPYVELYGAMKVSCDEPEEGYLPIKASGYTVFLVSFGVKYFFTEEIYLGIFAVINPLWQANFTKAAFGIDASFRF